MATKILADRKRVVATLDAHMKDNSFVCGYGPTQEDVIVLEGLECTSLKKYPHAERWFNHVVSYSSAERAAWTTKDGKPPSAEKPSGVKEEAKKEEAKDDDDDFDLFGEQTEEEKSNIAAQKQAAADKKEEKEEKEKKKKKEVIAKSTLVIDIKPMSDETSLDEVEKLVRDIKIEGLEWSQQCKRIPMVFGLFKLQIGAVIVDELVQTESILEAIETLGLNEEEAKKKLERRDGGGEDDDDDETGLVQSAEIISFQKI